MVDLPLTRVAPNAVQAAWDLLVASFEPFLKNDRRFILIFTADPREEPRQYFARKHG